MYENRTWSVIIHTSPGGKDEYPSSFLYCSKVKNYKEKLDWNCMEKIMSQLRELVNQATIFHYLTSKVATWRAEK